MVKRKESSLRFCSQHIEGSGLQGTDMDLDEWHSFLQIAGNHGIILLLHHNLTKTENPVPGWVRMYLKEQYYLNVIKNEFLYNELRIILGRLKEAGVEVIVMKGASLAETVYPARALRPFTDMDLLIRKERLGKAKDTLTGLGYALDAYSTPDISSEKSDYHLRYQKGASIIELHWDLGLDVGLYKYMRIDPGALWKNAQRSTIAGIEILILSPEDQIILSCIHLAKHKFSRFIWLYDIRLIAEKESIDWNLLIKSSKSQYAANPVFYCLFLSLELAGLNLPQYVLYELRPTLPETRLFKYLIFHGYFDRPNIIKDMALRILMIDRNIDRLRLLLTYPSDSLTYLLSGNKKKILRRLRDGTTGL